MARNLLRAKLRGFQRESCRGEGLSSLTDTEAEEQKLGPYPGRTMKPSHLREKARMDRSE